MTVSHTVIALDVGGRRIGVALASLEARIASPLITIDRLQVNDIFEHIGILVKEHSAVAVIVGLPRGMEGQETAQTTSAREFATTTRERLGVKVYLQDEAATSIVAEDELKQSGRPYQKGDIDKLAATYILNDWLASQVRKL